IDGNNEVALALIVIIPLMRFLQLQAQNKNIKRGLTAAMILSAVAALGSHSRGALLAIAAMTLLMWLRSERKFAMGVALALISSILVIFMPDNWSQRMETIGQYQEDSSAMGRINA